MTTQTEEEKIIATFIDKWGDQRVIHRAKDTGVLHVRREVRTPALALNRVAAPLIGKRIRERRQALKMTMVELAYRTGMASGHPKQRIWAIENATRAEAMRIGTLYAIAAALGCEPADLLPPFEEVARAGNVTPEALNITVLVKVSKEA